MIETSILERRFRVRAEFTQCLCQAVGRTRVGALVPRQPDAKVQWVLLRGGMGERYARWRSLIILVRTAGVVLASFVIF
jgi:hypothetical protein